MSSRSTRRGWSIPPLLILVLIALVLYLRNQSAVGPPATPGSRAGESPARPGTPPAQSPAQSSPSSQAPTGGAGAYGAPGALPDLPQKPAPHWVDFQGCPPEGDGGDPTLNRLKNRDDEAPTWYPVRFDAIAALDWPHAIEHRDRARWSAGDTRTVARYEGTPVAVEGYLAGAKQSGPESCNCHGADPEWRDFHVWLVAAAGDDRTHAIVVEPTPRLRARHPRWQLGTLRALAHDNAPVRVSGWLMFDPEHPEELGRTRGTLWEIHPVMQFEVERHGRWEPLDNEQISSRPAPRHRSR